MVSIRVRRGLVGLVGLVVALVCTGVVPAAAPTKSGTDKDSGENETLKALDELDDACGRVRAKFQKRLDAALLAMVQARVRGVSLASCEAMASAGLEQSLDAEDFEPLGKFLARQHGAGLKGDKLVEAIGAEIHRLKEARKKARGAKKEGMGKAHRSKFGGLGGNAYHTVYLIDRSGSMFDILDAVKKEVMNSVKELSQIRDFHVIMLADGDPLEKKPMTLTPPTEEHKLALAEFLVKIKAEGTTNPVKGVNRAFDVLKKANRLPGKAIYLLTDGAFPDNKAVLAAIRARNIKKDVLIHTFLLGGKSPIAEKVMRQIAKENGGQYRYVDLNR